jgi:hypothetical protein
MYYRKGTKVELPNRGNVRKNSDKSLSSADEESKDTITFKGQDEKPTSSSKGSSTATSKGNRFAKRMARHMQQNNPKAHANSSNDEDDSSHHSHVSTPNSMANYKQSPMMNEGESFDVDNMDTLNITHIPPMSSDGMFNCDVEKAN